jgi:hypothetical protein
VNEHFGELMHLRCCSIAAKAERKVVKLKVVHPRALES